MCKYLVVGAGYAGAVIAERIASILGESVIVVDKRPHVGGHCYDEVDLNGILVHRYGPHLFHTDEESVYRYLSGFTEWREYIHEVVAEVGGKLVPLPFNFSSIDTCFSVADADILKNKLLNQYSLDRRVPVGDLLASDDSDIQQLGRYIYENIFLNYTAKQWGKNPDEIDAAVIARVPVIVGYDNRYFADRFQVVPLEGYTKIFENMLNHENIDLRLGVEAKDIIRLDGGKFIFEGRPYKGSVIYTGKIDELFGYRFGELSYRSLDLRFETINKEYYQEASVVNYPNTQKFTRITEFKHIHPANTAKTTILKEYPIDHVVGVNAPFYPVFTDENKKRYARYKMLADRIDNLHMVGRLAEFKYYDMDDIVMRALELFEQEIRV